jgi:hypothetical protein
MGSGKDKKRKRKSKKHKCAPSSVACSTRCPPCQPARRASLKAMQEVMLEICCGWRLVAVDVAGGSWGSEQNPSSCGASCVAKGAWWKHPHNLDRQLSNSAPILDWAAARFG